MTRLKCALVAVILLATASVASAQEGGDNVDTYAAASVVQVVSTSADYTRLRAVVFMQEIYPALAIEAIEPGGEGAPATLVFRNVVGEFAGQMPQGPQAISQLVWKDQVLHFAVELGPDGTSNCSIKAKAKAKPVCKTAKK